MPMTRRPLVAANWKMHGQAESSSRLLKALANSLSGLSCDVLVCPPALYIPVVGELLSGTEIKLGGQNVHTEEEGAYTGEISARMLTDFGCSHVLVGHSERRELFHETDQLVAAKFRAIQGQMLVPVLCVGETLAQRESGQTADVVLSQLDAVMKVVGIEAFSRAVVAYEPVWAIGTGMTATPQQAQEVHALIRAYLSRHDAAVAARIRLLYGGSVKAANASELFAQADIDGGLVGGASLDAEEFTSICQSAV